jgi:guanylate kinase
MSLILAISGPAAVGKTTICDRLIEEFAPRLNRLVTATTRPPRPQEVNGVDYIFLTESEFEQKLSDASFLEHEIIHRNKYGILKQSLLNAQLEGIDILLNIDVNGTASLRRFCNNKQELNGRLKTIFIKPLTLEDLRQRMHHRASESDEQMSIRLANAKAEILREGEFDFVVESMDRDTDYQKIKEIYLNVR